MVDAAALLASVDKNIILDERTDETERLKAILQHWPEKRKAGFSDAKRSFLMNLLEGRYRERPHLFRPDLEKFHCDLSWVVLKSADFSHLDLRGANFTAADLTGSNFFGANLTGADLTLANLSECIFGEADLTGATFCFARAVGADFGKAAIRNARAAGSILCLTNFTDANLAGSDFSSANLSNSVFAGANIHDLDIRGSLIHGTSLDALQALVEQPEHKPFRLFSWLHRPRRAKSAGEQRAEPAPAHDEPAPAAG